MIRRYGVVRVRVVRPPKRNLTNPRYYLRVVVHLYKPSLLGFGVQPPELAGTWVAKPDLITKRVRSCGDTVERESNLLAVRDEG